MKQPYAPALPVREVFARFWPYTRGFRGLLALGVGLSLLSPVIQAVTVWLFKILVDRVLVPRDLGAFAPIAGVYIGITVAAGIVSFSRSYLSRWLAQHFVLGLRTDLFTHLHHLSLDVLERRQLGDVLARLTSDARAIERLVVSGVASTVSRVVRVILFTGALFWLNWKLALIALAVLPLFGVAAKFFAARIKVFAREARHYNGIMTAVAEESLGNAPLVQAYQRQDTEVGRFYDAGHRRLRASLAKARLGAGFGPLVDILELFGVLAVVGLGTWQMAAGGLTLGGLFAFMGYLSLLFSPVRSLSRLTNTIFAASAGAERISELFASRSSVRQRPGARAIGRAKGVIELDNVGFTYPDAAQPALEAISARVEPGQMLALSGPSGAGKSTVTKLIMRLYDPTAGRVRLDGADLRDLTLDSLRANIAVLLQETLVFHGTIADNIAYGRPGATPVDIRRAARAADVDRFVHRWRDGYDTVIGERGRKLSGGQRQRIAIARALIRDAPVLILDEPAAGLDADTQARIGEPLRRLMAGRTTIVIAHDPRTIERADVVLHLEGGRPTQSPAAWPVKRAAGALL
jgi:ABC-type multidrug transport system fused ATPase/permease subunit